MGFIMKLLLATALLCLNLFLNHGLALPVDSVLEKGPGLVAGSFKGCPCFAPAKVCIALNITRPDGDVPCFSDLSHCLAGCSLPSDGWYYNANVDEPKAPQNNSTHAKNNSSAGHIVSIETRLVEKPLPCLQACHATWSVCQVWAISFSTYTEHIATCDHFFEYCATSTCHLPVQPRPSLEATSKAVPADQAKRDLSPIPTVPQTHSDCTKICQETWQICVALVNGSKGMFALSGCDTYTDNCINNCFTPPSKRDGGISASLVERDAVADPPVNAFAEICDIHCGQAWAESIKLVNSGKLHVSLDFIDYDTQLCIKNCWARKRDGGISPPDASLAKRAAPVNVAAEICNNQCVEAWSWCIELINAGELRLSLAEVDDYTDQCVARCWALKKRDVPLLESRDDTTSSVALGSRELESAKDKCLDVCSGIAGICGDLVKADWTDVTSPLCNTHFIICSLKCNNNTFGDAKSLLPPMHGGNSMSLDSRDVEPSVLERQITGVCSKDSPTAIGHVCLPEWCRKQWKTCVILVNGSGGVFSVEACDFFLDDCLWTCNGYNCKRSVEPRVALPELRHAD